MIDFENLDESVKEEIIKYCTIHFEFDYLENSKDSLPLDDELFMREWSSYFDYSLKNNIVDKFYESFPQFSFPIQENISTTENYKNACLRGKPYDRSRALKLEEPVKIQLHIKKGDAGSIPFLVIRNRNDFVSILRAFIHKNEPKDVPDSMGACMIRGYNNWHRIGQYKNDYFNENGAFANEMGWQKKFKELVPQKNLYKDSFILLSDGPYSSIGHDKMNQSEKEWADASLQIRLEHEYAHYFTRRVLNSMKNHLHDELIADCLGLLKRGTYKSVDFLTFLGLEDYPCYRTGGRFENYFTDSPLSSDAIEFLKTIVYRASQNLEKFLSKFYDVKILKFEEIQTEIILKLSKMNLLEMANDQFID